MIEPEQDPAKKEEARKQFVEHVVRPRWDHPPMCECGDCWIEHEGRV